MGIRVPTQKGEENRDTLTGFLTVLLFMLLNQKSLKYTSDSPAVYSSKAFFFFSLLLCFVRDNLKKDSILECRVGWGLFSCQLQGEAKIRTNEVK